MTSSPCICSVFPNQNPVLDAGVIRVNGEPCRCGRRAAADLVARYGTLPGASWQLFWDSRDQLAEPAVPAEPESEFDAPLPPPEETLEVDVDSTDTEQTTPDNPFAALVRAMQAVLLGEGATRAAALLVPLMDAGAVELTSQDDRASFGSGPLVVAGGRLALEGAEELTRASWRRVLCGEDGDLSACTGMLDRWAAELVAALVGAPARADELRRELRRRGVAAFGMLEAA